MNRVIKISGATVGLGTIAFILMGASSCDNSGSVSGVSGSGNASNSGSSSAQTQAKVGQTITMTTGNKYTVFAIADNVAPADEFSKPSAGNRLLTTDVQVCAGPGQTDVSYNDLYVNLVMADNTKAQQSFASLKPDLGSGNLATGQCARGLVTFEAPIGKAVSEVTVDTSSLGQTLTFKA